MNTVLSICAVVATIIFACLAYSIIRALKHVKSTLGAAHSTLEEAKITISDLREEVGQVSQHTSKVIQHTNAITLDVQKKMKDLDIWFGTIKEVGAAVHSLTASIRQSAAGATAKVRAKRIEHRKNKAIQGLQHTTRQAEQQQAFINTKEQTIAQTQAERHALIQAEKQAEGQAGPSNIISAVVDGITSSIRIWNQLKQSNSNKSIQ